MTVPEGARRVLLVEDQSIIALATSARLSREGFEVDVAYTGEQALTMVERSHENRATYGLVLMDIDLGPGIDGVETARRLLDRYELPVVFLSGHTEPEYIDRVREVTRYGYVLKSSDLLILRLTMEMAIDLFEANQRSRRHERELSAVYDHAPIPMLVVDKRGLVVKANRCAGEAVGLMPHEKRSTTLGRVVECIHAARDPNACELLPDCESCGLRALVDETLEFGAEHRDVLVELPIGPPGTGAARRLCVSTAPLDQPGGRGAVVSIVDRIMIREHVSGGERERAAAVSCDLFDEAEQRMRDLERLETDVERYRLLVESAHAIPWEFSIADDRWTYVAPQSEEILGYAPQEWTDYAFWLDRMHPDDRGWASEYCEACSARGETHVFEYRYLTKANDYRWIRDVVSVEMHDGRPVRLRGYMIDITDRKRAEEHADQLAEQREVLLREMSHRVKNSLSTLHSLLALQAGSSHDESVRSALGDALQHVNAIASMYELLHPRIGDGVTDAGPYVAKVAEHVVEAMAPGGFVRIELEVVELPVAADTLLPLGLIVNELVTNSIKHGLMGRDTGTVTVRLTADADSVATLEVNDNGHGFATQSTPPFGLGLTLVSGLAGQIGGELRLDSGSAGSTAAVVFPLKEPRIE